MHHNGAFVEKTEKLEKLGKLFQRGRRGELFRSFSPSSNGHFSSFSRAFPVDERTITKIRDNLICYISEEKIREFYAPKHASNRLTCEIRVGKESLEGDLEIFFFHR